MKDPILLNKIKKEVDKGSVAASQTDDLTIFKYTRETQLQGLWNDVNREARGIIFRPDGEIVARPFSKFFNLGETPETQLDSLPSERFEAWEKLDGSMGAMYRKGGEFRLATPGSMESDQALHGTELLNQKYGKFLSLVPEGCTPIFEIIYPENRIVVNYGDEAFLSLLAIRNLDGTEWHSNRVCRLAKEANVPRPRRFSSFSLSSHDFEDNFEGYVVKYESGLRLKIKSRAYVRIHRLLEFLSPKRVIELIMGKEYGVTVRDLPKEIAQDFDDIRATVQQEHDRIKLSIAEYAANMPRNQRKESALWIQSNVPQNLSPLMFLELDGKLTEYKIWETVLKSL